MVYSICSFSSIGSFYVEAYSNNRYDSCFFGSDAICTDFVGLIIWGGLMLGTNRPRGLAVIGGGLAGALLAGLAFALVNTLTGQSVSLP